MKTVTPSAMVVWMASQLQQTKATKSLPSSLVFTYCSMAISVLMRLSSLDSSMKRLPSTPTQMAPSRGSAKLA